MVKNHSDREETHFFNFMSYFFQLTVKDHTDSKYMPQPLCKDKYLMVKCVNH